MADVNIKSKFVRYESERGLRHNRVLLEPRWKGCSYNQPIAKMIKLVNDYSVFFMESANKFYFKNRVRDLIYKDDDVEIVEIWCCCGLFKMFVIVLYCSLVARFGEINKEKKQR